MQHLGTNKRIDVCACSRCCYAQNLRVYLSLLQAQLQQLAQHGLNSAVASPCVPDVQVLAGRNRRYLVAPLGNLVDERYTTYFNVVE